MNQNTKQYSFLIIDTYYPRFLSSLYRTYPDLANKRYVEQKNFILSQCFGTADFYSKNLRKLGCEAEEIIPNNDILQKQWALEHGLKTETSYFSKIMDNIPGIKRLFPELSYSLKILGEQIKTYSPDVLYIQDLSFCPPSFLLEMKKYTKLLIGQIACPLPPLDYLKPYDLILTSFPHYVDRFKGMGIKSEYFKIGFEPSVLDKVEVAGREYSCTFVGGISPAHQKGTELLEEVARRVDIEFFGYGAETLDRNSPVIPRHHGQVWGLDMYRVLASSKITINRHIDVAENYANNMRLYEATGCGALLLTDHKDNLDELFKVGKEIVAYKNVKELIELIQYYLSQENERKQIAEAGQDKTLNEHSYYNRMEELIEIINRIM